MVSDNKQLKASRKDLDAFLSKVKSTPLAVQTSQQARLLFAIDATMSRQPLWDQASQLHGEMLLASDQKPSLAVQFVYYRGMHDFHASAWTSEPARLVDEMTRLYCQAGRTQIARTLSHILSETRQGKVSAAVFIGDAMEEDPGQLGKLAGQLGLCGTPLFLFQEGYDPEAESVYRDLARLSGGAWCRFDQGSVSQLKELLGIVTRYATQGRQGLEHYGGKRPSLVDGILKQLPGPRK